MSEKKKLTVIISLCAVAVLLLTYGAMCFACVYKEVSYDKGDESAISRISYTFGEMFSENTPSTLFKKVGYMLTGNVSSDTVKSGKKDFLFPVESDTFDYRADYSGEYTMTDEEYESARQILERRSEKYGKDGIDYYLVVIPNSQSVYGELAPFKGELSDSTRIKAFAQYMNDNSFVKIHLTDGALKNASQEYTIYNNTENTISQHGAYYLYSEIFSILEETYGEKATCIDISSKELLSGESKGRTLAAELGMERSIKNKVYYYDISDIEDKYTVEQSDEYHTKSTLNDSAAKTQLLVQIPYEYERSHLKPFLSATYSSVTVCQSHIYCEDTVQNDKPKAVLQVIREDDVNSIFDEVTDSSYGEYQENVSGEPSEKPQIKAKFYFNRNTVTIMGTAEDGAVVNAKSGGTVSSCVCEDGMFTVTVKKPSNGNIMLTSTAPGKGTSEAVYTDNTAQKASSDQVLLGKGARLFFTDTVSDFLRDNTYSEQRINYVRRNALQALSQIRDATGKNTQMIILCAPNPATVYPEQMSDELAEQVVDGQSRLEQFNEALGQIDGITMVDVTEELIDAKDDGKLYYITDTHWTELGAYYGYYGIMSEIAKTSPACKPYELSDFEITETVDKGGDLAEFIHIDRRITENVPHLSLGNKSALLGEYYKPDTIARPEQTGDFTTRTSDRTLPVGYMMRDSYSMQMIPYIGEHFSNMYYEEMWNYEIDYDVLSDIKPDYVIMVFAERNIGNMFMK